MNVSEQKMQFMMQRARTHRQNQRVQAQGECVRASGKSAEEIKGMSPQDFVTFSSNIQLCTDTKLMTQDMMARPQGKAQVEKSRRISAKVRRLMME